MAKTLPAMPLLRAFDAAVRHLQMRKAAQELNVTESAISHQIRRLEADLGAQLFERGADGLSLTEAGLRFAEGLTPAMAQLNDAIDSTRRAPEASELAISAPPAFASLWLAPRLVRFQRGHPGVTIRLATSARVVDFRAEKVDAAIRYGHGDWPRMRIDHLLDEKLIPVASPKLLAPRNGQDPIDLLQTLPLIGNAHHPDEWSAWALATKNGLGGAEVQVWLEGSDQVLPAAAAGEGIAIGRSPYVQAMLASGALAPIVPDWLPIKKAYYLVAPEATAGRPLITALRRWLKAEIAAEL